MYRFLSITFALALLGRTQGASVSQSSEESDSNSLSSSESSVERLVCNALAIADPGSATIFSVDFPSGDVEDLDVSPILSSGGDFPVGIDIDPYEELMFFASGSVIYYSKVDGSDVEILIDLGDDSLVEGLAVDPYREKLFFTDSKSHRIGYVHYPDPHTSDPVIVALDNGVTLGSPKGIELDTDNKMLYWVDTETFAEYIGRAEYDGSHAEVIVAAGFFTLDLTLDLDNDILFWSNAGVIESIHFDGTNRHLVLDQFGSFFAGIELVEDFLYVTETLYGELLRMPKSGGPLVKVGETVFSNPFNIAKHCVEHDD